MNLENLQLWPLLAGLGLFLFGMFMLEEALKALAGRAFKKFLRKHTGSPVKSVLSGALITGVLQSSSMVSLLVMSLAGAGIIGLKNGIGMVLGANLGTTATGWLVSLIGFKLNIGEVILPFLAIGGLGIIFFKSDRLSNFSKALMGFSLLFLGLDYMKDGFDVFSDNFDFSSLNDKSPLLFLLFGFLLTAAIQSSSAAMMIFLSSLAAGVIEINSAVFLVIGADLGTSLTAVIGTVNANLIRKKIGWSQFIMNIYTAVLALVLMPVYLFVIEDVMGITDPIIVLVAFHTSLNLAGVFMMLPLLGVFTKFIDRSIKGDGLKLAKNIMLVSPSETHASIEALHNESTDFVRQTIRMLYSFFKLQPPGISDHKAYTYPELKSYENEVVEFYIRIQQSALTASEVERLNLFITAIRNAALAAKDLKDIKHNLDELMNSSQDDLYDFFQTIRESQKKLYDEIIEYIIHKTVYKPDDVVRLKEVLKSSYHRESEEVYKLYGRKKHREIVIPSMLNMIVEINSSNEALLRALLNLISAHER